MRVKVSIVLSGGGEGVEIEIKEAMSEKGMNVMGVMTDNRPQIDIKEAC